METIIIKCDCCFGTGRNLSPEERSPLYDKWLQKEKEEKARIKEQEKAIREQRRMFIKKEQILHIFLNLPKRY